MYCISRWFFRSRWMKEIKERENEKKRSRAIIIYLHAIVFNNGIVTFVTERSFLSVYLSKGV